MPDINKNKPIKAAELKTGDTLEFLDGGTWLEIDFSKNQDGSKVQECLEFNVSLNTGLPRKFVLNSTSGNNLAKSWGGNSDDWQGKKASVTFIKMMSFGEIQEVLMLEPVL